MNTLEYDQQNKSNKFHYIQQENLSPVVEAGTSSDYYVPGNNHNVCKP